MRRRRLLRAADAEGIGLDRATRAGVYPTDYAWQGSDVDRVVQDSEWIQIGALAIEAIATPGHSHDHFCYLVRGPQFDPPLLIAGDALFWGGRVAWQDKLDCDVAATCASIRRLAALPDFALLPGHGAFSLQYGGRHAKRALARIDRLLAPKAFD